MNNRVCNSDLIKSNFNVKTVKISYANNTREFGKINIRKPLKFIVYFTKLFWQLIYFKPDLIYFQLSPTGYAFFRDSIYILLMKIFKQKIIVHLRGKGIQKYIGENKRLNRYYKFIFKNLNAICLSELLTFDVEGIANKKPFIVYNGIPVFNYTCEKKQNKPLNILFLSNLIKEKGVFDFIDALKIINNKDSSFIGTIVGEEADISKSELEAYIEKNNLTNTIKYIGPKYDEDKYEQYCNADIFIFPTYYSVETWGGVLLEAMQFGLPVVSTFEASIPIIVDNGITGFLVNSKDPYLLSQKIQLLIDDEELRIKMGNAGKKKFFEKYTFETFENNLIHVFNTVIKNNV